MPVASELRTRVVQSGAECTMAYTPSSPDNVRLTITVTPDVHAAFKRLAAAGGMSISRAMGDWLGDTVEAAEFMADKMEQARAAPRMVMQELHAYALGVADETGSFLERMRQEGRKARAGKPPAGGVPASSAPPSGNTGGKGPRGQAKSRRA